MKKAVIPTVAALKLSACQSEEANNQVAEQSQFTPVDALAEIDISSIIAQSVTHQDRLETDLGSDARRLPAQILEFAQIGPEMCVLDLFTAGGYYAELLSRVVGPQGDIWAQNPPQFYENFGSADLDFRLADRRLPNVMRYDRPMDDMALPPERFDAVVAAMVFHDLFWLSEDVPAVLSQIYTAMRPGATMLITDHAAPEGTGAEFAMGFKAKHRIEEDFVVQIMREAGFELEASSDILRIPEDDRTMAYFEPEMRGKPTDRFVLLFRKPAGVGS